MKKILSIAIAGLLSGVVSVAFAANAPVTKTGSAVHYVKQAVVLKKGQKYFTVKLKANATTGYQWFFKSQDNDNIDFKGYRYIAPKNGLMGAPGTAEFTFKIDDDFELGPQMTDLRFAYMRLWGVSGANITKVAVFMPAY